MSQKQQKLDTMNKNWNDIEKALQDKLHSSELTGFEDEIWLNVSNALQEKKRKRFLWIISFTLIGLSTLLAFTFLYTDRSIDTVPVSQATCQDPDHPSMLSGESESPALAKERSIQADLTSVSRTSSNNVKESLGDFRVTMVVKDKTPVLNTNEQLKPRDITSQAPLEGLKDLSILKQQKALNIYDQRFTSIRSEIIYRTLYLSGIAGKEVEKIGIRKIDEIRIDESRNIAPTPNILLHSSSSFMFDAFQMSLSSGVIDYTENLSYRNSTAQITGGAHLSLEVKGIKMINSWLYSSFGLGLSRTDYELHSSASIEQVNTINNNEAFEVLLQSGESEYIQGERNSRFTKNYDLVWNPYELSIYFPLDIAVVKSMGRWRLNARTGLNAIVHTSMNNWLNLNDSDPFENKLTIIKENQSFSTHWKLAAGLSFQLNSKINLMLECEYLRELTPANSSHIRELDINGKYYNGAISVVRIFK